jgi:hypothetical protein
VHQGCGNNGQLAVNTVAQTNEVTPLECNPGDHQVPSVGLTDSPALAMFNGLLYCAHQGSGNDGQLWYTTTLDGKNWTKDQQVPGVGMSVSPALLEVGRSLCCFHQGSGNSGQLWYTTFDGKKWTPDQQVYTWIEGQQAIEMSESPGVFQVDTILP